MKTYYKVSASEPAFVPEKEALMSDGLKNLNEETIEHNQNKEQDQDQEYEGAAIANNNSTRATFEIDMSDYNANKKNAASRRSMQKLGSKASSESYASAQGSTTSRNRPVSNCKSSGSSK